MLTYQGSFTFDPKSHKRGANYLDLTGPNSFKRLKTSASTPINEPQQACSKPNLIFQKMCANIALDYYNNKNDKTFELVEDEALDSSPFADSYGSWIHCSFNAKEDSSIRNFFAELQYIPPSGPVVTTCKILTQGETKVGCQNCFSVIHPVVGYRGGNIYNELARYPRLPDPPTFKPDPPTFNLVVNFNALAWREKCLIREKRVANRALDHYNKTNGTKFAIVNDDYIKLSRFSETWVHLSFDAIDSSAVKLFFAEIKYNKFSGPAVTICKIVEGETKEDCEYCPLGAVTHPVVGYRGDFLVETEIDDKDRDSYYKVYCEEFLNETYDGSEVISHS